MMNREKFYCMVKLTEVNPETNFEQELEVDEFIVSASSICNAIEFCQSCLEEATVSYIIKGMLPEGSITVNEFDERNQVHVKVFCAQGRNSWEVA